MPASRGCMFDLHVIDHMSCSRRPSHESNLDFDGAPCLLLRKASATISDQKSPNLPRERKDAARRFL
jgi:hypothetical protein